MSCRPALWCLLAPAALAAQTPPAAPVAGAPRNRTPVAIAHVTVIDVERGQRLPGHTVLVAGRRISAVGPDAAVRVPVGARVVDGRGKYLIPGLWDMHVHLSPTGSGRLRLPLLLANGVTGVRSMTQECLGDCVGDAADLDSVRAWRADAASGRRVLPRIVATGPSIDGPRPTRARAWKAATAAEAAAGVRYSRERGADFAKVVSMLPREAFFGAMREARRLGMPVIGHVPAGVAPSEASDSGMTSMEHDLGIWEECSTRAPELLARLDSLVSVGGPAAFARISAFVTPDVMASYDSVRCDALFRRLARNGTWLVPTIVLRQGFAAQGDTAARNDSRLRYVPAAERTGWDPLADFRARALTPADFAARRERLAREPRLVGQAYRAGAHVLAGTDMGNPYVFPGWSLHEELALLVSGGLTPVEALRTATLAPAEFLRATDSLGTIAPGKLADLVLLDADPLADIHDTRRIRAVVTDGHYLDRAVLDALLAGVERAANTAPGTR